MDTISEKPLDNLIKLNKGLIVSKLNIYKIINYQLINNGIILSTKNHKFFEYLIEEIYYSKDQKIYQNKDWYIMDSTGPIVFSRAMLVYIIKEHINDVLILEPNYLESCNMESIMCTNHGKYITHIHTLSWGSPIFKLHFKIIHYFKYYIFIVIFIYYLLKYYIFI